MPPAKLPSDAGEVRLTTTSGSVGQPFRGATNRLADMFSQLKYRSFFHDWGVSPNKDVLSIRQPKPHELEHRGQLIAKPLPGAQGREFTLFSLELERVMTALREVRPPYLRGYPTLLHAAASEARRSGDQLSFERVMTVGETLHEDVRRFIEETFPTRVADAYAGRPPRLD